MISFNQFMAGSSSKRIKTKASRWRDMSALPCSSSVTPCNTEPAIDQLGDGISGDIAKYWELLFDPETESWKDDADRVRD